VHEALKRYLDISNQAPIYWMWNTLEPNVEQVRRMTPAQRVAAARHPECGRLRVRDMLEHWAEHDLNHLAQIRAALAG